MRKGTFIAVKHSTMFGLKLKGQQSRFQPYRVQMKIPQLCSDWATSSAKIR